MENAIPALRQLPPRHWETRRYMVCITTSTPLSKALFSIFSCFLHRRGRKNLPEPSGKRLSDMPRELQKRQNGRKRKKGLEALTDPFHITAEQYLATLPADRTIQENFSWSPQKGRTRYCDMIAIDLVRKINDGTHPAGTLLPNGAILANIYHVSPITIRRTIALLNKLGVAKTVNGVGTRVVSTENTHLSVSLKAIILGNNLRTFLEAYNCSPGPANPSSAIRSPTFRKS